MTREEFRELLKEELLMLLSGTSSSVSETDGWGEPCYLTMIDYDKFRMNLCKKTKKGKKLNGK